MWRHLASNFLTLMVVIVFLLGGVLLWGQNRYTAEGPLSAQICLRVPSGSNMRTISNTLEERGAIENGSMFRMGADYLNKSNQLKAGSWLIPAGSSMTEITDIITRGGASTCGTEVVYRIGVTRASGLVRELDPQTSQYVETASFDPAEAERPEAFEAVRAQSDTRYRIAIAEGVTSWQINEVLKQVGILEGEVAELPPEGSLAPDSYEVRPGDSRLDVLARMSDAQQRILAAAWDARDPDLPLNSPEELLTLASIVEKETAQADERERVSSVFVNRLRRGMRLQTDPTVIYGITKGQGTLGRGLRQSELRAATDWNTYVIEGLPPTPIANPGRASIEAASKPETSDFIFFVADGTGGHAFAKTLAEHNENVARWRQIEAEQNNQ